MNLKYGMKTVNINFVISLPTFLFVSHRLPRWQLNYIFRSCPATSEYRWTLCTELVHQVETYSRLGYYDGIPPNILRSRIPNGHVHRRPKFSPYLFSAEVLVCLSTSAHCPSRQLLVYPYKNCSLTPLQWSEISSQLKTCCLTHNSLADHINKNGTGVTMPISLSGLPSRRGEIPQLLWLKARNNVNRSHNCHWNTDHCSHDNWETAIATLQSAIGLTIKTWRYMKYASFFRA